MKRAYEFKFVVDTAPGTLDTLDKLVTDYVLGLLKKEGTELLAMDSRVRNLTKEESMAMSVQRVHRRDPQTPGQTLCMCSIESPEVVATKKRAYYKALNSARTEFTHHPGSAPRVLSTRHVTDEDAKVTCRNCLRKLAGKPLDLPKLGVLPLTEAGKFVMKVQEKHGRCGCQFCIPLEEPTCTVVDVCTASAIYVGMYFDRPEFACGDHSMAHYSERYPLPLSEPESK